MHYGHAQGDNRKPCRLSVRDWCAATSSGLCGGRHRRRETGEWWVACLVKGEADGRSVFRIGSRLFGT